MAQMETQKNYTDYELGFNRTQMFKEWNQPQTIRSTALKSTLEYCSIHGLQLGIKETMQMAKRFQQYLETGDTSWVERMELFLEKKKEKEYTKAFGL